MPDAQSRRLRILLTNNTLAWRAGSEMYVRDMALALMKRGHFPVAYSSILGDVAQELQRATVPVIDDLTALREPPDIIHGQHHLDTMTAVLHFPTTPAIFVCHGWIPWEELPPVFPSIMHYVGVDDLCRERLATTMGLSAVDLSVIYNFVDLERFALRATWRDSPRSALIFGNTAGDNPRTHAIKSACARAGIERVDIAGSGAGNSIPNPEHILGDYDVVFAKARCALEAMASGAAVIVADHAGLGGMVTMANVAQMRSLNFGVRTMQAAPVTEETVLDELKRYDARDARQVSAWIRAEADMSSAVTRWLSLYETVMARWQAAHHCALSANFQEQSVAASRYLRSLATVLKARNDAEYRSWQATLAQTQLAQQLSARETELAARTHEAAELAQQLAVRDAELNARAHEAAAAQADLLQRLSAKEQEAVTAKADLSALDAQLKAILSSSTWQVANRYGKIRAWFRRS
ncbi:glycosyltransferase [Reyranella sp. CPCC 100927]|uniref:glycosyltransferase n=1 Tax=Reyranella sp. CPCC 100927 TaxID=2599616 RepID=UPI0011B703A8|nr:glycosyltransferase [Reyranella sp. CPCC 100927]TWS99484.1 glycosyltransferase [Reyranella sp. CPCC 100927]